MRVFLRPMNAFDLELIMAWRNIPQIYEGAYTQKESLKWEEHYTWFNSRSSWWKFFIVIVDDEKTRPRAVGVINFGQLDNWNPELNYYLGEVSLWGQGIGKEALQQGLNWLKKHGYCATHTTVKNDNLRSINVLKSLGFIETMPARVGETRFDLRLSDKDEAVEYTSGRKHFLEI